MSHKQSRGKHQESLEYKTNCFHLDLPLKYKNVFMLPVSFIGSYTDNEPDFPWSEIIEFCRKRVSGVDKVVNFKDFSRPNKEIKHFSGTLTEFEDFQDDY